MDQTLYCFFPFEFFRLQVIQLKRMSAREGSGRTHGLEKPLLMALLLKNRVAQVWISLD